MIAASEIVLPCSNSHNRYADAKMSKDEDAAGLALNCSGSAYNLDPIVVLIFVIKCIDNDENDAGLALT